MEKALEHDPCHVRTREHYLARVERHHRAIQNESPAGAWSGMRSCTGGCKRRRSVGQFKGDSTVCIRCAPRQK